jgi:hypothetical protein
VRTSNDPEGESADQRRDRPTPPLRWSVVLCWLVGITAILAVAGVVLGRDTRPAPFLVVLPALIAGRGTVRQTAVAAVWVTIVIAGSLLDSPLHSVGADAAVIVFALVFNGLSVARAAQRIRWEGEIARLRSAAVRCSGSSCARFLW